MSGPAGDNTDAVTVCTDATESGTIVRVVAPSRHLRMVDLMPVFEALDLNLVSYTAERDPDAGPSAGLQIQLGRRKHSFRGRFLVTDADGQNLSDELLDGLVAALQDALHVRLSRSARCGPLQEPARRDSYASYEGSMDPDSPSYAGSALHAAHSGYHHGHGGHTLSHLHPNAGSHPAGHPAGHQHPQHAQLHHNHHEHTTSVGSLLLSDHSISSASSLLRVPSGAPSDQATVPCPPAAMQHEFTFLQQLHEPVLFDGPLHSAVSGSGIHHEERLSGAATTPFAASSGSGAYHHQHTRSQPVPTPMSQAPDLFDIPVSVARRSSSTSTPLAATRLGHSRGAGEGSDSGPVLGNERSSGRSPHVTFSEPPQSTSAAASVATGNTTPLSSRPPSAPMPFLLGPNGSLAGLAGVASGGAGCSNSGAAALEGLASTLAAAADCARRASGGGKRGDESPAFSDDREGDGSYAWWSTFSAQDSVARIMSTPARSISADADLGQAKSMMQRYNISALLVDTGGSPGFITKRDFLKVQFSKNFKRTKVKDVMTQPVIYVDITLPIEECSRVLEASGVRRVLVHDPSRATAGDPLSGFVGVVSDADLFKCMGAPAMSPVVGSAANECGHGASLAGGPGSLQKLPTLPSLPSVSTLLPGTSTGSAALASVPSQPQLRQPENSLPRPQQQPLPLQTLSSAASTASVSQSVGPSHAPSMGTADPAAAVLAAAGSSGSVIRLHAEASLADRYRCAAALWELDFSELEVTRRIGEGSFGEVLLANFRGTKVAVKRLRGFDLGPDNPDGGPGEPGPSPTQMPIFRQFFEREIEILATIRHPNVVNFIGACHTPPNVCLVTEYCARGSLDHLLHKTNIHVDTVKKVEFSMDIARGMSCLHSQKPPIIHRDLKTANLLVSARFEVKVADFGLSRIKDHAQLINSRAGLEGTVEYAAPEVLRGEPYTEKCDIWSYAVLLWEIIHRQRPYADADVPVYILMMSLGNGTLRLPPVREELATPGLARLVERCMAWHPADRPSFREVLHVLEAEYKILRGKAAAVPRSDSASSMVVLPGAVIGQPSDHPHAHPHPHSQPHPPAAAGAKEPHPGQPHHAGQGHAAAPAPVPRPHASPHPRHPSQGAAPAAGPESTPFAGPGCSRNDAEASAGANEAGAAGAGVRQRATQQQQHQPQPQQPQQRARPRVQLAEPHHAEPSQPHGAGECAPDPVSPAEAACSSRPLSSRTASKGAGPGKPGSAGRPMGRSLRSAARSKSMPLPEFEWFGADEDSEGYVDTTESVADEEGDAAVATPACGTAQPLSPLAAAEGKAEVGREPYGLGGDGGACTPFHAAAADEYGDRQRQSWVGVVGGTGAPSSLSIAAAAAAAALDQRHASADAPDFVSTTRTESWSLSPFAAAAYGQRDSETGAEAGASLQPAAEVAHDVERMYAAHAEHSAPELRQRPTPLRLSPFSPFADAAGTPWSPRTLDDPTRLPARSSVDSPSTRHRKQQQLLQQQQPRTPTPAAESAAAGGVLRSPPRRVAFLSPFAQLAAAEPDASSSEAEDDELPQRGSAAAAPACNGAPPALQRPAAATSSANSTDVHVLIEKDQQSQPEGCWGVLGTCSKPPSGDVHPNGSVGRLSPSSPCAPSQLARDIAVEAPVPGEGRGPVAVAPAAPPMATELAEAVSEATAGLDALSLGAPGAMVFPMGSSGMADAGADSDQFDGEDDDATLHTTAWVRL